MDVTNLVGKTVLVTGAGSGIGRETALAFARRGADLVVCDVNEANLAATEQVLRGLGRGVVALTVDVSQGEAMERFAATVHERVEAVDILVNNAGVGLGGGILHTTLADWDWILGINLMGVIYGCHFFVPAMVKRGRGGHVVNISSVAGFMATEQLAAYSVTKFAVFGLSEALRGEVARHGIGVTAVCPGVINTAIVTSSPMRGPEATPQAVAQMAELFRRRNYSPARVADHILRAVQRNRAVAPVSPEAWMFYMLKRFAPGLLGWANQALGARMRAQVEAH